MEAETYLSSGFGIRMAIQSKPQGWSYFRELAKVSMPNRFKGILVSSQYGIPPFSQQLRCSMSAPSPESF
jgi:hypothetical protein